MLGGCGDARAPNEPPRPDLVLIVIDTLRKDRMSLFGHSRETTPFIDSLAAEGLVFGEAVAQAPWTAPSMASLWTSRLPREVGVESGEDAAGIRNLMHQPVSRLRPEATTLAEVLTGAGYHTVGITSNYFASSAFSLLDGFEDPAYVSSLAEGVIDAAIEAVNAHREQHAAKPLFLYVHLIDLHGHSDENGPVTLPAGYDGLYPTLDGRPHERRHYEYGYSRADGLDTPEFEVYKSHKLAIYDGAMRLIDDQLARFHRHLGERAGDRPAVFAIVADHGEEFWEHSGFEQLHHIDPRGEAGVGHGHSMFDELIGVPLIFHGDGIPRARVDRQVRNLDVMPTLLGLARVPTSGLELRGTDLIAALRSGDLDALPALSESIGYGAEATSYRDGRYKLIAYAQTRTGQTRFLFDTVTDPAERRDLSEVEPAIAGRLDREMQAVLNDSTRRRGATVELDSDGEAALRALGYLE